MSVAGQESDNEPEVVDEPAETVTVEPEEGGDEPAQASGDEPQRQSRKERRANEMKAAREAAEQAERRAQESEARLARMEREHAELRGWAAAQNQRSQGDPQAALKEKAAGFRRTAMMHLERAAAAAKAGDKAAYDVAMDAHYEAVEDAAAVRYEARAKPEYEQMVQQRIQQATAGIVTPRQMALRETVMREFPWVATDEIARDAVDGEINRLVASGRQLEDIATIREAATKIAKRMGIGGRQAPTEAQRQRFAGVRGNEGGAVENDANRVVVGAREKKLARLSYPDLEEKDAIREWSKMVAKSQRKERGE